jgi:CHAT domain-containing protein
VSPSDLETLRQLDPLPGTRLEIETLAKLLAAPRQAYLLGQEANERELSRRTASGQVRDARVLVFATHGLIGGELSESIPEPALVLSPPKVASAVDDGLLTASEVKRMKIRADWVMLSACNTAAGSRPGAEGLTGMARSFLYAGARSLLISHWRVVDAVGPRISARAIELARTANKSSLSRASAVREAMKEVMLDPSRDDDELTTFAHPAAWAAFTFIGVD